jgi:hypothetical protein
MARESTSVGAVGQSAEGVYTCRERSYANRERLERDKLNLGLEGVIESYELAFRMEGAMPKLMDLSEETPATHAAYGIGEKDRWTS